MNTSSASTGASPGCEQTLLVQAEFDGELGAAEAAALVRHRDGCDQCLAVQQQLQLARTVLRNAPRYTSSPELRERVDRCIEDGASAHAETERRAVSPTHDFVSHGASGAQGRSRSRASPKPLSWRAAAGWAAAAAAALVAIIVSVQPGSSDVGAQLVNSHLRAMQLDSHLVDVVSTDHHTVKPWFAGKVAFAPPVKQLDSEGYVLKGGRIDVVDARTAAVLVYQAGRHTVEVFIWPAEHEAELKSRSRQLNGFNLLRWEENGFEIGCISDMAADELDTFARRWRAAG